MIIQAPSELGIVLRLLLAALVGGALGLERTIKLRPAGLRTYMLISVGACLVMLTGLIMYYSLGEPSDPVRMAAQVVSGIGFIGVGTILTTRSNHIRGLTTAAGVWAAACLGLTIGAGLYLPALAGFAIVGAALWLTDRLEDSISARLPHMQAHLVIASPELLPLLSKSAAARGISMEEVSLEWGMPGAISVNCTLRMPRNTDHMEVMEWLMGHDGVYLAEQLPN